MNQASDAEKESSSPAATATDSEAKEPKTKKQSEVEQQQEPEPVLVSSHAPSQYPDDESIEETSPPKQLPHLQNPQNTTLPPKTIDTTEAVRSLKDPKLIKGRRRSESPPDGPTAIYITPTKNKSSSTSITPETHKITVCTISSAPSSGNSAINDDSSIRKACGQHRQTTEKKTSCSELQDILEDFQLCGIYFCREFLGRDNDTSDDVPKNTEHKKENITTAEDIKMRKEERMREMDDTFLGKMIQCECGDVPDTCGTSGDYTPFGSDEGRDELGRDECCRELKY